MQEFTLAHYWMAGVMLVMAVYGGFALAGHCLQQRRLEQTTQNKNSTVDE